MKHYEWALACIIGLHMFYNILHNSSTVEHKPVQYSLTVDIMIFAIMTILNYSSLATSFNKLPHYRHTCHLDRPLWPHPLTLGAAANQLQPLG